MFVTLPGIVMFVRPVQPWNACQPMLVTLSGIVTLVRPMQPKNALLPMLVTLFGITTSLTIVPFRYSSAPLQQGLEFMFIFSYDSRSPL